VALSVTAKDFIRRIGGRENAIQAIDLLEKMERGLR
jgi:hypothetical protein